MERIIRVHAVAFGRVQGVGFRFFVYQTSCAFGLTGFAHNLYDGSVEIELQGEKDKVNRAVETIKNGNRFIDVEDMTVTPCDVKEETGFSIN